MHQDFISFSVMSDRPDFMEISEVSYKVSGRFFELRANTLQWYMQNSLQLCDSVMTYEYTLHNALVHIKCLKICMKLSMCVYISKES